MSFVRQYRKIMQPEVRVARGDIKPRNCYRISTYTGSKPITKTGEDQRWVFVIGIADGKIHCIRLNDIKPELFTEFVAKIRDKRVPIGGGRLLSEFLKKYTRTGSDLFESQVKNDKRVYRKGKSTYRIYKLEKIRYVWEVRFEVDMLQAIFKEGYNVNETTSRNIITDEIQGDEEERAGI